MAAVARTQDALERRIGELMHRLDLDKSYGDEKRLSVCVLADKKTPNPHGRLARADLSWDSGATQDQINGRVCEEILKREKHDREIFRDYVLLPLREVGVLEPLLVQTAAEMKANPSQSITKRGEWKSKSPTSSYIITVEAEKLLLETADKDWPDALDKYIRGSVRRRERAAQQRAAAAVAGANPDSKHSVLIAAAAEAHKESPMLSGYELLFIDDGDGDRIKEPYATKLKKAGLELNLDTRYPDTIFAHATKRELWIIDAVTSDGEIDPVRLTEISKWAEDAGWTLAGATTAYETFDRYAARQKAMTNIASDTYVWIAEIGGQLLHVKSLA